MRVIVVGAGPTGLTAAVELARRGVIPIVIERRATPSTLSRAVGILPSSIDLLRPSGVAEQLLAEGVHVQDLRIYLGKRAALHVPLAGAREGQDFLVALAQDRTEAALRAALTRLGGEVRFSTALQSLSQTGTEVVVTTDGGEEFACDYLIGADGINSQARQSAGIAFSGIDLPGRWSIADVDAKDWRHPTGFTLQVVRDGVFVGVVPLEEERFRVFSNTARALDDMPLPIDIQHIRREAQFQISVRQAETYQRGRLFLAGDAAHAHSPVGGRGMNLGIADAAALASALVEGTSASYSAARHTAGQAIIGQSEQGRRLITSASWLGRARLRALLMAARLSRGLRRRAANVILGDS